MFRAIISGAASPSGRQLLRILLHHPDVHISNACQPQYFGRALDQVIPGIVGDTALSFSEKYAAADGDVLFIADNMPLPFDIDGAGTEALRIIDLTGRYIGHAGFVTGIGEMNRKPLVRGARRASVPDALTVLTTTALLPLAANLMLGNDIDVTAVNVDDSVAVTATGHVARILRQVQTGYNGVPRISAKADAAADVRDLAGQTRFMAVTVTIPLKVSTDVLRELYTSHFDDHNFVYLIGRAPVPADVVNTAKTLMYITRDADGRTVITAAFDPLMKGSAAAAVHCMNLLFGLSERTGLELTPLG